MVNERTPRTKISFLYKLYYTTPRGTEKDGVEYIFLSPEAFKKKINDNDFLEYEEVLYRPFLWYFKKSG